MDSATIHLMCIATLIQVSEQVLYISEDPYEAAEVAVLFIAWLG